MTRRRAHVALVAAVMLAVVTVSSGEPANPLLALKLGNVPTRRYLVLDLDATGLKGLRASGATPLLLEALDERGKVRLTRREVIPLGPATKRLDYASLPTGSYRLRITALSPGGKPLTSSEAAFRCPAPPVWLTDQTYDDYGKADRVPLP